MRHDVSRRTFLIDASRAMLALCGASLLGIDTALGDPGSSGIDAWLSRVQRLSAGVKQGAITSRVWRRRLQRVTGRVPLADVLRATHFDSVVKSVDLFEGDEPQEHLSLVPSPGLEGFAFSAIVSHIRQGYAVVPHGHHNMVSMHLILQGSVHLRQYDRLHDEPMHLVLRPTVDRLCSPGDTSAISADRGNVHWFRGLTDSFALIIAAYDLDPMAEAAGRDYVDPLAGEEQPGGSIRVPRVTEGEARRRYLAF
ncbi:MAG TPA: hypothetical protein VMS22_09720 [Candidatus Eisenbacteria bacterium]|nr:hypothetical protein [Candidatus Eisenbacteria bacterium]